jgi:phage major head subunit gpT-like protein
MAISRAQMMKELLPGLNALFGLEYKTYDSEYEAIYETESSERAFEEEVKLAGFGAAPVKSEGSSITYDTAQEDFTSRYTHETIAMGFSITEEAVEDNLYDSVSARYTKALARAMAHTKEVKGAFPLNNAFTGSSFLAGDGQNLCDTDHPLVSGGTVANRLAVASDLNETSLEQAVIDMAAFVDSRGLTIAARPRKLIVAPYNQFVATRILETELRPGTADNDTNALRTNGTVPEGYSVNHFLTNANRKNWFLMTDVPNGMKHFTRTPLQTGMDGDFDTGNVRYKARERYSFGVSDYLGIFGSGAVT